LYEEHLPKLVLPLKSLTKVQIIIIPHFSSWDIYLAEDLSLTENNKSFHSPMIYQGPGKNLTALLSEDPHMKITLMKMA